MKIITDQIPWGEQHAVTRADLKNLVSLLPQEAQNQIKVVHLSNQTFTNKTFDRPVIFSSYSSRLTILSRGFKAIKIVEEILIELAQSQILDSSPTGTIHWALYRNHLKEKDYKFFKERIQPYLNEYIKRSEQDVTPDA
jgi:hypothetical protein